MALDVHVEAPVPVALVDVLVEVGEVPETRPAVVADDEIESAHLRHGLGDETDDLGSLGDVGPDGDEAFGGGGGGGGGVGWG